MVLQRFFAIRPGLGLLWLVVWPAIPFFHLILSILAFRIGISLAFAQASERDAAPGRPLLRGPALLALCLSYLLTLWRSHGALLGRAALLTLLGSAVAILALRNNQIFFERRKNGFSTIVATNDEPFAHSLSGSEYELRSGHLEPRPQTD